MMMMVTGVYIVLVGLLTQTILVSGQSLCTSTVVTQIGLTDCAQSCDNGYHSVQVDVDLDRWNEENHWTITSVSDSMVHFQSYGNVYGDYGLAQDCTCLQENMCYFFEIYDCYGDGIFSGRTYTLTANNEQIAQNTLPYPSSYARVDFCLEGTCSLHDTTCVNSPCDESEAGNCQVYHNGQGCSQCESGSFKKDLNNGCVNCQEYFGDECLQCADGNGCQQCINGYDRVYDENCGLYKCEPNSCFYSSSHCNVCNNGICSQCDSGYIKIDLSDTHCIDCQSLTGDGCMFCSDYIGCQQCKQDYTRTMTSDGYYTCVLNADKTMP